MKLKKRILSFLLCAIMTITSIPALPAYAADTVTIGSAAELPTELEVGKTYELTADITLSENQQISTLAGVLDGKGHTITLNGKPLADDVSGTIQNLGVKGNISVSGVDGSMATTLSGTIQNCYSTVLIGYDDGNTWKFAEVGGLAGNISDGTIKNSYFSGSISGYASSAGLVGSMSGTNNLYNNYYMEGTMYGVYGFGQESDVVGKETCKSFNSSTKKSDILVGLNTNLPTTGYKWALPTDGSNNGYPVLVVDNGEGTVDKSSLDATIAQAESLIEDKYTPETWSALKTALSAAKVVSENESATQPEVNSALKTLEDADIWTDISDGIANGSDYLSTDMANSPVGIVYGHEWHVITMHRAGKNIDQDTLDQYYDAVVTEIKKWDGSEKPTDMERTALALSAMGKDITDVNGVNLAAMIYNSSALTNGSNELAFALLALDAKATEIPETAIWSRAKMVDELLKFQKAENGGFGLTDNITTSVDMTAMCIQALAPYEDQANVAEAIDKALDYLRANITADYDYSDSCATAQVLLALAVLKIDVTDAANGFGNAYENIITRLYEYKTDNGFLWMLGDDAAKTAATYQVMQAFDAYRKAMKEDLSYWNFGVKGDDYQDGEEDQIPEEPINPGKAAEPIDVYVTISNAGKVTVMQKSVEVTDLNKDGHMDVDEVLYAAHEKFYVGGAAEGYATASTVYGQSITKLWGDTSGAFGYWKNNASCWSLGDVVEEGDYVNAFVYQDKSFYSDAYSYFESNTYKTVEGQAISVLLKKADGYDEFWNTLFANYESAAFRVYKDGKVVDADQYTIKNKGDGIYEITFAEKGTYYLVAVSDAEILVPAVCEIVCAAKNVDKEENINKEDGKKNDSAVNTGDQAPVMMLIVLMVAAAMTMVVVEKKKYRN